MSSKNQYETDQSTKIAHAFSMGIFYLLAFTALFFVLNMNVIYNPNTFFLSKQTKEVHNLKFKPTSEIVYEFTTNQLVLDSIKLEIDSLGNKSEIYLKRYKDMSNYYVDEIRTLHLRIKVLENKLK
jgi:hypothetical protein